MMDEYTGKEKREFFRYDYNKPIQYSILSSPKDKGLYAKFTDAISKNLSASGILFLSNFVKVPDIASLVVLDVDYKTIEICQEIEERALIVDNKLIGRVVRIEDNEDGTCGVGVAFVTKSDPALKDTKNIADLMKHA